MTNSADLEKRTLTIERTFNAPRKLVWKAWTEPEHISRWWGRGMDVEIEKHEFKVEGSWKYTMQMPDGNKFITYGVYSRIDPEEWIESSANFIPMTEGVSMQIQFIDNGNSTDMVFKVIHPTEEYCKQQEDMGFFNGWGSIFGVLDQYLTQIN